MGFSHPQCLTFSPHVEATCAEEDGMIYPTLLTQGNFGRGKAGRNVIFLLRSKEVSFHSWCPTSEIALETKQLAVDWLKGKNKIGRLEGVKKKRGKNVENVAFADYLMLGEGYFPFVFWPLHHHNLACFPLPAGITNTSLCREAWTLP